MIAVETDTTAEPSEPLRILMTTDAVGGVWRYSVDLATALMARGMEPTLVVMGPAPSGEQIREARRAHLPIVEGRYALEWMENSARDVEDAGQWLQTLAQALQPDIVHLNGFAHAVCQFDAPAIVVAHSCIRSWWRAVKGEQAPARFNDYTNAVTRGLESAAAVVAPTRAMLDALSAEYGFHGESVVIPNGYAGAVWTNPLSDKKPLILSAGRVWDEGKNIGALCQIAHSVSWPILVAGDVQAPDGPHRPLHAVRHLGQLSRRALAAWYRRASIYALPARYEPFGLSVLEAAAAGCALVLGNLPSLRENWSGAAVFVPPDDPPALRAALVDLIDRRERRHELAAAAFARAQQFTIDRTADDYVRFYRSLVA